MKDGTIPEDLRKHEIAERVIIGKGGGDLPKISVKTEWSTGGNLSARCACHRLSEKWRGAALVHEPVKPVRFRKTDPRRRADRVSMVRSARRPPESRVG